jgi:hypothetical protein
VPGIASVLVSNQALTSTTSSDSQKFLFFYFLASLGVGSCVKGCVLLLLSRAAKTIPLLSTVAHILIQHGHIGTVDVSSSNICDKDWEKRGDARSISRMNTTDLDWFRPCRQVIALRPVFTVLRYELRCP